MGCGESKHAVSTQDSTISQSKRSNSKKNADENVTNAGGNDVIVKESDDDLKVVKVDQNVKDGVASGDGNVKEVEKVDQVVLEKQIDQSKEESSSMVETVKEEGKDKEGFSSTPLPPPAVDNGDGNAKEGEKVDEVVLEKQIYQSKEKSMVEAVKEAEDKEATPSPPPPPAAVADHDEAKGGEEKKELKEENFAEAELENAEILAQPTDIDASEEKRDSGKVQEPIKEIEIETHQEAKNDKDFEDQKEPKIETVESAEAKDSAQNDADQKIPIAKGEIEVESAAEAEKKAD